MLSRRITFVAASCLFAAVSGCQSGGSSQVAMTEGDRIRMRGEMMQRKGEVMSRGERLVAEGKGVRAEGEAMKNQGRSVKGERKMAEGDALIREGEAMIAKAEAMPTEPPTLNEQSNAEGRESIATDGEFRTASDTVPTTQPAR